MKKYTFSKEICYSKRLKTRTRLRYVLTCSLSVFLTAGLVIGLTVGVVHRNDYSGQGGFVGADYFHLDGDAASLITLSDDDAPIAPTETAVDFDDEETAESIADILEDENEEPALDVPDIEEAVAEIETIETEEIPEAEERRDLEDSPLYYTVYRLKQNENASIVAGMFGVSTDTILSVNGVTNATRMATGAYLKIPSMSGILYEVKKDGETLDSIVQTENRTKKVNLDKEILSKINGVAADEKLSVGYTLFLAGDKLTNEQRAEISGTSFKNPLRNYYYVSSPFGWRVNPFDASKRSYHNGLDMACPKGTPIYATAAGTVITAGYTNVYGNYVIIKHTSGYKSLYGHMSVINVSAGQYVDQGTIIGKVGSTGQSTGPHLHFTIYKNDKAISPYERVSF